MLESMNELVGWKGRWLSLQAQASAGSSRPLTLSLAL